MTENDKSSESRFIRHQPKDRSIVLSAIGTLHISFQKFPILPFHPPISPSPQFSAHFSLSIPFQTTLRGFLRCKLMWDVCKTKRWKKGYVWVKIWLKKEVVGVTIYHSHSHHSTPLQQTQFNHALLHAYSLSHIVIGIDTPFIKLQFIVSASPSSSAQLSLPSRILPDWMNIHYKHTEGVLSSSVHIVHQSSMGHHNQNISTPSQSVDNTYTKESIPMPFCSNSLAMRNDTMSILRLSISYFTSGVRYKRMHCKPGEVVIHSNCNYTHSW